MIKEESVVRLFVVCNLLSILMACATPTAPHENFKSIMQSNVGKKVDDPYTSITSYPNRIVTDYGIANGNKEIKYRAKKNCIVFFEVDKASDVIIAWRFEGSEEDCVIVP